ncbi:hypothetical protein MPH_00100 [Macrophomina phaseolina MS6]|uniref:Uncharacterized protein n=1 Tax=Macrophomina phaseolina (strain MS6) TaxID=1126212 RepID=K2SC79_MACPH|nr:hypothetical protein MPH_00100 [Macrophomina phaseolina MS6]
MYLSITRTMQPTTSMFGSGLDAEAASMQRLSDITTRLTWNLSACKCGPKHAKAAIKNIRRDLAHLEKMPFVSSSAIRESEINVVLQDLMQSTIPGKDMHRNAEAVHQNFSNIVLADDLISWSSDRPSDANDATALDLCLGIFFIDTFFLKSVHKL